MANALSLLRLTLVPPLAWAILGGGTAAARVAALLFVVAIASDLLDGRIARRRGTTSALGRALDHGSDFAFVASGLAAAAVRGVVPWLLPGLVALAFAQYAVDSYLLQRTRRLRMSALGRWNGILYFVPLGGVILVDLGADVLAVLIAPVSWALVVSTLASMADRLLELGRRRTAPDSRGGETAPRSPR
ncbi:MAG: CDP-alcohol phosphatidyltransferase family protein [Myxococcota bacterium]